MPGKPSQSKILQYIGASAALLGVVGYTVFGWRFGQTDNGIALAIGGAFAIIAVGWTLYQRF